jgi:hypothetical protein
LKFNLLDKLNDFFYNTPFPLQLKIQWTGSKEEQLVQKFLPITFNPIMILKTSTSLLATNAIFILDILRSANSSNSNINNIAIDPLEVTLHQEQNIALEPVEAQLLNPKPFKVF